MKIIDCGYYKMDLLKNNIGDTSIADAQDNLHYDSTNIDNMLIRGDVYFDDQLMKLCVSLICVSPYLACFSGTCLCQLQSLCISNTKITCINIIMMPVLEKLSASLSSLRSIVTRD